MTTKYPTPAEQAGSRAEWTAQHQARIEREAELAGVDLEALGLEVDALAAQACAFERLGELPGPLMLRAAEVIPAEHDRLRAMCAFHRWHSCTEALKVDEIDHYV